jgi:hydrogenase maturation protease
MIQKTVILGLGNTILTDDGVGIYVTRTIQKMLTPLLTVHCSLLTIKEASLGGFNFIDLLAGFDRAVIIDAIHTKSGKPGEFYELDPAALKPSARLSSLHGIDFATAVQMAKDMNVPFPSQIKIFVMEVEDEFTFNEKCTPKVTAEIPRMAESIIKELKKAEWIL